MDHLFICFIIFQVSSRLSAEVSILMCVKLPVDTLRGFSLHSYGIKSFHWNSKKCVKS